MKPNAFTRDIVGLRKELLSPTYDDFSLSLRERRPQAERVALAQRRVRVRQRQCKSNPLYPPERASRHEPYGIKAPMQNARCGIAFGLGG
jgi:hypothetical protein